MARAFKNRLAKKAVVLVMLMVVTGILLGLWVSTAKYTSQIDGTAQFEPALFNTVLLGNLTFKKAGTNEEFIESNGKLSMSIEVTPSMDFGALDGQAGLTSSERRLRPGSVVAIPFTVTNGTTLPTDGESNLAGTDIVYSLDLITTVNIPLEYDIYQYNTLNQLNYMKEKSADESYNYQDYIDETTTIGSQIAHINWGRKLNMDKGDITASETVGYSREYSVQPSTYKGADGSETENKFYLQRDTEEESIAVNRYMLVIYWPDIADGDETGDSEATKLLRDTKYMKEIDILEIRLEVESWTQTGTVTAPEYNEAGMPLLRLSATPITNEAYYQLPETGQIHMGNVYSRHTVPFYATREKTIVGDTVTSYLDFVVTNRADAMNYSYDEESDTYQASQITELTDGRVAIAIPVQATMGTFNNYQAAEHFSYSIEYAGVSYTGKPTEQYITTQVWDKNEGNTASAEPNVYNTRNAYQILVFEDAQGNALTLPAFSQGETAQVQLQLQVHVTQSGTKTIHFDNKDDFKILVYQQNEPAEG